MQSRFRACLLIAMAAAPALERPARAVSPADVDKAVTKAMAFLHKRENADGNWEEVKVRDPKGGAADVKGKQWGGLTAIATYALLAAGDDPVKDLAKPIDFLKSADIVGIYATGLRCQTWLLDSDEKKKLRPNIERDKETLLHAMNIASQQAPAFGFYGYYIDNGKAYGGFDRSVSQYGVLGMWALEQAGAEVPQSYWRVTDAAWKNAQNPDGGWNYNQNHAGMSTTTMTAAGIATLFITQDYLLGNLADCRGNVVSPNIDRGLGWMDTNIKAALSGSLYGMYGIERIGVASGRKYFDVVDWYQTGADGIVKRQAPDGSWGSIPDTCFALLFLVRGRAPVVMNKLEYNVIEPNGKTAEGQWNERPRDCANFAHWMAGDIEQFLNWQIVNLKVGADALHDSQIIYISGNRELTLAQKDIDTLRTFCEQGGLILGNADCGSPTFTRSFEKMGAKMFQGYEFRDLPPSHVIFTGQQFIPKTTGNRGKLPPRVKGLSNGIRELMLLIPEADFSRAWQGRNDKTKSEIYQLAANIFLYSVDKKNLHNKGDVYLVQENPAIKPTRAVTLARLEVGENWNPEPAGWTRVTAILHNDDKVALTVKTAKCDAESLKGAKIAHLTGTTKFKLSADQRAALKTFVETGGTLIVDSAGGSSEFADAAEAEIQATFGKAPDLLSLTSQVFNLPFSIIDTVKYRPYARRVLAGQMRAPRIRTIDVKGRPAVFYSREDLSAGIVGEQIDGIVGYDPATATAMMRNFIMFGAFGFPPPPTTQSTTRPATRPTNRPAARPVATTAPAAPGVPAPAAPAVPAPATPAAPVPAAVPAPATR
ncbi:MAG TPA: DUF4159 domain-containing protein [Tepidisphaeraceae bacterium]|nr:DUF4159 domain-containing protein [Tepidisphaeraceae bacterium]